MPYNIAQTSNVSWNEPKKFKTYKAWKAAVKALDPKAQFTGDKDIDSCFKKGSYDCDWDGDSGEIRTVKK